MSMTPPEIKKRTKWALLNWNRMRIEKTVTRNWWSRAMYFLNCCIFNLKIQIFWKFRFFPTLSISCQCFDVICEYCANGIIIIKIKKLRLIISISDPLATLNLFNPFVRWFQTVPLLNFGSLLHASMFIFAIQTFSVENFYSSGQVLIHGCISICYWLEEQKKS